MSCGIVVALPEEVVTLTSRKLAQGECIRLADDLLLAYAGAGPVNAELAAKQLIAQGADRLISWGCAAAIAPQLKAGDLVCPQQLIATQASQPTDTQWLQHLQNVLAGQLPVLTGDLVESSQIVGNSLDKQRIHQQTGAIALDMESAAVVRAAHQARLPSLVIRAIADPADMDLPQAVVHALNSQGQVELSKLLRFLLTHPGEIPALIKLGLHFNAAQKTLKTVARQLEALTAFEPQP